jgi:hypothetical protein
MNQWTNWQKRLAGEKVAIHEGEPDSGFYRIRRKDKATGKFHFVPAAFWKDDNGELHGVVDGRTFDGNRCIGYWLWAVQHPITEAEFRRVEAGGSWSDIDDEVHAQTNGRGIGDNSGTVSDLELIREQIESAKAGAEAYAEITDDATLTRAQTLRSRLLELSNEADSKREKEKAPHFQAAKDVDAKWQPLVKSAKAVADTIRAAMIKWETTKLKARPAEKAPAVTKIRGASGKAAHVGVIKVITAVTDQDALYAYFRFYDNVKSILLINAQTAVKNGHTVPGVTITEEADVR